MKFQIKNHIIFHYDVMANVKFGYHSTMASVYSLRCRWLLNLRYVITWVYTRVAKFHFFIFHFFQKPGSIVRHAENPVKERSKNIHFFFLRETESAFYLLRTLADPFHVTCSSTVSYHVVWRCLNRRHPRVWQTSWKVLLLVIGTFSQV